MDSARYSEQAFATGLTKATSRCRTSLSRAAYSVWPQSRADERVGLWERLQSEFSQHGYVVAGCFVCQLSQLGQCISDFRSGSSRHHGGFGSLRTGLPSEAESRSFVYGVGVAVAVRHLTTEQGEASEPLDGNDVAFPLLESRPPDIERRAPLVSSAYPPGRGQGEI